MPKVTDRIRIRDEEPEGTSEESEGQVERQQIQDIDTGPDLEHDLRRSIHSLNEPGSEAIKVDDGSKYVGVVDATGKQTTVLCPHCGSPVHGAAQNCPTCNESIQGDPEWELVRCVECGKTFPETRESCPSCGSESVNLMEHVECAKCSAVFNPARGGCPECGSEEAYEL